RLQAVRAGDRGGAGAPPRRRRGGGHRRPRSGVGRPGDRLRGAARRHRTADHARRSAGVRARGARAVQAAARAAPAGGAAPKRHGQGAEESAEVIRLCYSNRMEELAAALGEALPAPGDAASLFDGPWLVIPGRPLELYLDIELARRRGVSGGFPTFTPAGLFARLTADALPDVALIERGHIVTE